MQLFIARLILAYGVVLWIPDNELTSFVNGFDLISNLIYIQNFQMLVELE
jgi:hypothetical protein